MSVYGVPYSEHSSFPELRDCVARLRPKRLVPTVRHHLCMFGKMCSESALCSLSNSVHLGTNPSMSCCIVSTVRHHL